VSDIERNRSHDRLLRLSPQAGRAGGRAGVL